MSAYHRPTAREPPHAPPLDHLQPVQPELLLGPDTTLPIPIDLAVPASGLEEEPV